MNPIAHGASITRVGLGLALMAHSLYLKAFIFTLPGTASYFESIGLPAMSAYLVFAIEAAAGIALVLGYRARIAAAASVPILLGATWAHAGNGWLFTNTGGGWEYPLFLTAVAIAQIFLGAGSFALDASLGGSRAASRSLRRKRISPFRPRETDGPWAPSARGGTH